METPTSQGIRLSLVPLRIHPRTGSSGLSAPFCPLAFLLSPDQSEGWLVGAVGIEPTTLAKTIARVESVYPTVARQTRVQGTVRLHTIIGTDASVEELKN